MCDNNKLHEYNKQYYIKNRQKYINQITHKKIRVERSHKKVKFMFPTYHSPIIDYERLLILW